MVPILREHCYSLQWMGRIFRTRDRTSMISKDVIGQDKDAPAEFSGQGLHNIPFLPPATEIPAVHYHMCKRTTNTHQKT